MKEILVLYPKVGDKAYQIAAEEFVKYFEQMTDYRPTVSTADDGISDLVLIGAPSVNTVTAKLMLDDLILPLDIRTGTDDFAVKTSALNGRRILLLQGGLGRSTIYAVYAYFEKHGCAWFWDGDCVPKRSKEEVWNGELDFKESTDFKYRGLRYFAHRGCKRFRAEMWDFEDWKKEIDYLTKRRLNLFMLRIGQDDLFQRAFPDDVKYPTEETMDELGFPYGYDAHLWGGYSDRRLFWSLEYRGELRKKVLAYAFDRGFIHPEDCGTMTHWYSLTPTDFIEKKKPTFFYDNSAYAAFKTGLVWDIRDDVNFQYYMQLTKAHIKEYGKAQVFHTIGFAERIFSEDREKNFQLKKYVYDRYLQELKFEYPTCPVFIAGWDLWLRYTSEEVQRLVASLDETQSVIFDYTSDSPYKNNFTAWNVVGNFPYVFGIFHAYASYNDCLGFYPLTEERLQIAKSDPYCKGVVYWPEISHSDTLMQEFFTRNAWDNRVVGVDEALEKMCEGRYGKYAAEMKNVWQKALPVIELMHWTMREDPFWNTEYYFFQYRRYLTWIYRNKSPEIFQDGMDFDKAKAAIADARSCLALVAKIPSEAYRSEFIRRDITDVVRTLVGRYVNITLIAEACAITAYRTTGQGKDLIYEFAKQARALLEFLCGILSTHNDFSLLHTLRAIDETEKIYDGFEVTLKNNTITEYCRTAIYESVKEVFLPEFDVVQAMIKESVESGIFDEKQLEAFEKISDEIDLKYVQKPLVEIHQDKKANLFELLPKIKAFFENVKI